MKLSPSSLKTLSVSPENKIKVSRVVLRGGPFKNPTTVKQLVRLSVPKLTEEDAERIVEKVEMSPLKEATVIVCLEKEAQEYCRNLVENGLESVIT